MEHEIFPVIEGYDVTLTYNLYHKKINPVPAVDVSISPFYKDFKMYLQIPHFLHGGGTLGFTCQHAYTFEEFDTEKGLSLSLKGSDRVIFLAAKSLGLRVNVRSIVDIDDYSHKKNCYVTATCIKSNFDFVRCLHVEGRLA